jgi:hypothetical protein
LNRFAEFFILIKCAFAEPFPRVVAQILERFLMSFLPSQRLLKPVAAGEFLGLSAHTLAKKRMTGEGPRFAKIGGAVRYDLKDLQEFVARSVRLSTSDQGADLSMTENAKPAIGADGGLRDLSSSDADSHSIALTRRAPQVKSRARLRRQRHVEHLQHFIKDIEKGADIDATLEAYAKLDADFIKALGGDRFAPSLHCIDGGRR